MLEDEPYIAKAEAAVARGDLNTAIAIVERAYREGEVLRDGFALIGNVLCQEAKYDAALKLYERDNLIERLTPAHRQVFAYLLSISGDYEASSAEISRASLEDPSLVYGYSPVDPVSGRPRFQERRPREVSDRSNYEENSGQLRMIEKVQYLAESGSWKEPEEWIDRAYESDTSLQDGYAYLGGIHRAFVRYELALHCFEKDDALGRLSASTRIIYGNILAQLKDFEEAEYQVELAYEEDDTLRDGYALIGSAFRYRGEYEKGFSYYERDADLFRLSPVNRHIYADQLARKGRFKEAELEVSLGYEQQSSLCNGYARLGSICRAKGQLGEALNYYQRDSNLGRLTPMHELTYAELLARAGKMKVALEAVKNAYSRCGRVNDGYSRCAWQYLWPRRQYDSLIQLFCKDDEDGRLSPRWKINLAKAYAQKGESRKAIKLVEGGYACDPTLKDGFVNICASANSDLRVNLREGRFPVHISEQIDKELNLERLSVEGARKMLTILRKNSIVSCEISKAEDVYKLDLGQQWNELQAAASSDEVPTRRFSILNSEMRIGNASDILVQFREIILHQQYRFVARNRAPFIIDGGSNAGMAILYFKWLYPDCQILAFEPNPVMFDICRSNIEHNGWEGVTLLPYALSDFDGESSLHIIKSIPMASSLSSCVLECSNSNGHAVAVVPTRRLSGFVEHNVDFLKLDIEGMEGAVLNESKAMLNQIQSGFIEYHHHNKSTSNSLAKILAILEGASFVYRLVDQPGSALGEVFYSGACHKRQNWSLGLFFNTQKNLPPNVKGTAN